MLSLHVAQSDGGQPSPAEIVYGCSLILSADLITPSSERMQHNALVYSHRLKAHLQNERQIITRNNTTRDQKYQRDPTLNTCSKIFLKKMNKTGLQDNYMGPFDVVVSVKLCIFSLLSNVVTGAKKLLIFRTPLCGTTREWWTDFTNLKVKF